MRTDRDCRSLVVAGVEVEEAVIMAARVYRLAGHYTKPPCHPGDRKHSAYTQSNERNFQ